MSRKSLSRSTEIQQDVYRGKDCMKKFCEYLREYKMKVDNFKNKKNGNVNKRAEKIK